MQEHLLNNNIGCIEICVQGFKIIGLALLNNNIGCIEVIWESVYNADYSC